MDINRIRLGLMYIFKESSSISNKAKLHLINFIEGANEYQLKALALDGELIPKNNINGVIKKMLDSRFSMEPGIEESIKKASIIAIKELSRKPA